MSKLWSELADKMNFRSVFLVALMLAVTAPVSPAQTNAPAAKQPAPVAPPLSPEQKAFNEAARSAPADAPFPKEIDCRRLNNDGSPNPNFGKVAGSFRNYHEAFLKRKAGPIGVLFLGDSITAGWNGAGQAIWTERYAKLDAANFGISGDKTEHVLWRIDNGELDGIAPKVVILLIGANNAGDTAPRIAAGITAIAKKIHAKLPQSKLLLLGVFPRDATVIGSDGKPSPRRAKMAAVNLELAKLHDGQTTFYLEIWKQFLAEDGSIPKEIMGDALHPSGKGYQIWADAMQPTLDALLK